MFALMGNLYPWASPVEIGKLTVPQLGMYLDAMPNIEKRRHASNATIAWLVANFGGKAKGTPEDWLPGHAKTEAPTQGVKLTLEGEDAEIFRFGLNIGVISQRILGFFTAE